MPSFGQNNLCYLLIGFLFIAQEYCSVRDFLWSLCLTGNELLRTINMTKRDGEIRLEETGCLDVFVSLPKARFFQNVLEMQLHGIPLKGKIW